MIHPQNRPATAKHDHFFFCSQNLVLPHFDCLYIGCGPSDAIVRNEGLVGIPITKKSLKIVILLGILEFLGKKTQAV